MISVKHLNKTYDKRSKAANQALHDLSLTLPDTGFVCIVGQSGCGKTSLLNAIGGLDTFESGTVSTDTLSALRCGNRLTELERSHSFGYIFQNYYLLPEHSAAYNVYLGLHSLPISHKEKLERVTEALRAVDMERFARREAGQLSGGQQQRVAIARALARRPRVIFADEPTGNLDESNTLNICTLLRRISRTSLVVMVTHEERIARFFADRIITLETGRIVSDCEVTQREALAADPGTLYTNEYQTSGLELDGLSLRLLREDGAPPVKLTLVAEKNRIVLKLDDTRTVVCAKQDEAPRIEEGTRPILRLEELEQIGDTLPTAPERSDPPGRAGVGLNFPILFREAWQLFRGKGKRQFGSWAFLVLLTVLTLFTVGDYLMVSSLDPEDFITTDSHILEVQLARGGELGTETLTLQSLIYEYMDHLDASGLAFSYVPHVSGYATYSTSVFLQMSSESEPLSGFSYVPLSALDESTLILGRAPQRPDEIVIDRWVLEAMMERDGILQSGITDVAFFLNETLSFEKRGYSPVIVGITDCGEPAIFLDDAAFVTIGVAGTSVISLSDLKALCPGEFDTFTLTENECLVVTNNAGIAYADRVGGLYTTGLGVDFTISAAIEANVYASIVVADEVIDTLLRSMMTTRFYLYCEDKAAMKEYLSAGLPAELEGKLQIEVQDRSGNAWAQYRAASSLRMDERRIVTLTVLLLSLVMLYLLQRSKVQERIGMAAVYRLLGIPRRKLAIVFALECLLLALTGTLPAALLAWLAVTILSAFPSVELSLLLPWYAAAGVFAGTTAFHLLVSLLPLMRLLRLPPARLAAKYDL